jgi:hypothetical protein
MNLSDKAVSYIRTYTPALAGMIIGWLVSLGLPVAGQAKDALTAVLVLVFTFAWYAGARWAEGRWPAAGWLLGDPHQPVYPVPVPDVPVIPGPAMTVTPPSATGTATATTLTVHPPTQPLPEYPFAKPEEPVPPVEPSP